MDLHLYVHFESPTDKHALVELHAIKQMVHDVITSQGVIMSKISEFATVQAQYNADNAAAVSNNATAVAAIATAVEDLTGDVANLNAQIAALQTSSGAITPEDQALLDGLTTSGAELTAKMSAASAALDASSTALAALAALTPPVVPVG
jgi:predicted  nucleic acid-binding Zn-ribbon protein